MKRGRISVIRKLKGNKLKNIEGKIEGKISLLRNIYRENSCCLEADIQARPIRREIVGLMREYKELLRNNDSSGVHAGNGIAEIYMRTDDNEGQFAIVVILPLSDRNFCFKDKTYIIIDRENPLARAIKATPVGGVGVYFCKCRVNGRTVKNEIRVDSKTV